MLASATKAERRHETLLKKVFTLKPGSDPWISAAVIGLMIFGSIMVISTNLGTTVGRTRQLYTVIFKQAVFCLIAWEAAVLFSRVFKYRAFRPWQGVMLFIYTILLVMTAVIGTDVNGSKAWIQFGSLSVQPSEFGKPLLIMMLAMSAGQIHHLPKAKQTLWTIFRYPLLQLGLSVIFVGGLQKDFGSLIITLGIGLIGILLPSWKTIEKWQRGLLIAFVVVVALFVAGVYFSDLFVQLFRNVPILRHIAVRIENMHNPYLSIHDEGYQPANALYGIADAGLFGRGLGSSVRKYGFLTQAESDYILAIIVEETGCIGLGLITLGYGILMWRLFYWALRAKKISDKVLFTCSAACFILHFFINIGGVSTLIPMTGVPLLLISAGGSALFASCIVIGLVQARIAAIQQSESRPFLRKAEEPGD